MKKATVLLILVTMVLTLTVSSTLGEDRMINGEKLAEKQYLGIWANGEPTSLDTARFSILADRNVFSNALEPLLRIFDGAPVGAGAESWDVSEDNLVYTFYLRENYWSDGQKVVADDYALNFRRQADPANTFRFISNLTMIKNLTGINNGEVDMSELGVVALDDMTLQITLDKPNPEFLTTEDFYPCRADYVEKYGEKFGTEAETVISCGPFVLTGWVHDSKLSFERNDLYWNKENVYLDSFDYFVITDLTAQFAAMENGTIGYLSLSDEDMIKALQKRTDMTGELYLGARTSMFVFNMDKEVFANEKIRQAFSLSINREEICEMLYAGLPTPAYGLVPVQSSVGGVNFRGAVPEPLLALKEQYPDPKALLIEGMQEAGFGDDPSKFTVTLSHGSTSAAGKIIAEYYQQMWQDALGIVVELRLLESTTNFANMDTGDFEFTSMSWGANLEPLFLLSRWQENNDARWDNPAYIDLVNTGSMTIDPAERLRLYAEAEQILLAAAPMAPISYSGVMRFVYDNIRGVQQNSFDNMGMQTLYIVE